MSVDVGFDVCRVRAAYPALGDGHAYLDGAAGTQVPDSVIAAISGAYQAGLGNSGGAFPASQRSDDLTAECRRAVADLTGGDPAGVILGPSMTALTYRLADTLMKDWSEGDEVVVTQLDHDANIRPWVQAAGRVGARVRWAKVELPAAELPTGQFSELIGRRTRLVAVSAASNILGTRPDIPAITALARAAGALSYVDGVHATAHGPVDIRALGADFYATSAYKWSGPHVAAVVADPAALERLDPDRLAPVPDTGPDRFERGTLPFADLAGVTAAAEHLADLAGPGSSGNRRDRILAGMRSAQCHEQELFGVLLRGLGEMSHVVTYGNAAKRTATVYFNVVGRSPREVAASLAERKINVWDGDNYAWELVGALGLRKTGGAVRAGLTHYNNSEDVDRLLEGVAELA